MRRPAEEFRAKLLDSASTAGNRLLRPGILIYMTPGGARIATIALSLGSVACAERSASAQEVWRTDFARHVVPLTEIVSGGPSKCSLSNIRE